MPQRMSLGQSASLPQVLPQTPAWHNVAFSQVFNKTALLYGNGSHNAPPFAPPTYLRKQVFSIMRQFHFGLIQRIGITVGVFDAVIRGIAEEVAVGAIGIQRAFFGFAQTEGRRHIAVKGLVKRAVLRGTIGIALATGATASAFTCRASALAGDAVVVDFAKAEALTLAEIVGANHDRCIWV